MDILTKEEIKRIQNSYNENFFAINNETNWKIEIHNWKLADYLYIKKCISESIFIFKKWFGKNFLKNKIIIMQNQENDYPISFPQQNLLYLAPGGNFGCQIILQIAHELMHIFLRHFGIIFKSELKWAEETLCEMASLKCLKELSILKPNYPLFFSKNKNQQIAEIYLNGRLNKNGSICKCCETFSVNIIKLEKNCYLRDINLSFAKNVFDKKVLSLEFFNNLKNSKTETELIKQIISCEECKQCKILYNPITVV